MQAAMDPGREQTVLREKAHTQFPFSVPAKNGYFLEVEHESAKKVSIMELAEVKQFDRR